MKSVGEEERIWIMTKETSRRKERDAVWIQVTTEYTLRATFIIEAPQDLIKSQLRNEATDSALFSNELNEA